MNNKEIQDSARIFSESAKDIQNFFCNEIEHINYFTEAKEVKYVLLCSQGLIIGIIKADQQEEVQISWEDFLTYLYKVHCGY